MERTYDLIVLGTGPGGSSVAHRLAEKGRRVAVVEAREPGGTCALRGCNPKKVFVQAAEVLQRARDARNRFGEFRAELDWPTLRRFKQQFVEPVTPKSVARMEEAGIDLHRGRPSFRAPLAVQIEDTLLRGASILIATGARPAPLDFEGSEHVATSEDFMNLEQLPRRILFVGGGYISMEFAHVAARAGARVTVIDRGDRVLKHFDPELVERLVDKTRSLGVDVRTGIAVERVDEKDDGFEVRLTNGRTDSFDLVVHGAGRVPSLDGLELASADVASVDDGVLVDEFMRSVTNPAVLAIGDCAASGDAKLTPAANAHAHAVAQNLLAGEPTHRPDTEGMATVLFTEPALASAGLSVDRARERGIEFEVLEGDRSDSGSVQKLGADLAAYRILVGRESERILGAHLLGPRADETINLFTLALRAGLTRKQLKAAPFAFPTFGHDVRSMV